jgi:hypothetical protein
VVYSLWISNRNEFRGIADRIGTKLLTFAGVQVEIDHRLKNFPDRPSIVLLPKILQKEGQFDSCTLVHFRCSSGRSPSNFPNTT